MRNGNRERKNVLYKKGKSSYRTYEEWKPVEVINMPPPIERSYRTYEEWKPCSVQTCDNTRRHVLTVPMRNGNVSE